MDDVQLILLISLSRRWSTVSSPRNPTICALQFIYDHMEPQTLALPGEWETRLNAMQKLCMLRCVRADKMPDALLNYVMTSLGKEFVEPPPFDLEACYSDSTVLTPLIFVLSKGSGETMCH